MVVRTKVCKRKKRQKKNPQTVNECFEKRGGGKKRVNKFVVQFFKILSKEKNEKNEKKKKKKQ